MLNLIHLEELKIPFPEELEKFDDKLELFDLLKKIQTLTAIITLKFLLMPNYGEK